MGNDSSRCLTKKIVFMYNVRNQRFKFFENSFQFLHLHTLHTLQFGTFFFLRCALFSYIMFAMLNNGFLKAILIFETTQATFVGSRFSN